MTGSTFARSHSPRREKGRAGSARSKLEDEPPGFSRRPRVMPEALSANRVSCPMELKMILFEDAPGGEAFQRQQRLRAGEFAQGGYRLHVAKQLRLVDQIVGGLDTAGHA